jgi:hypothetical protein
VVLAMGCTPSGSLTKRQLPAELLQKPPPPQLAPEGASDNELAEERIRFGAAYRRLEKAYDGLVCWVREKKPPC